MKLLHQRVLNTVLALLVALTALTATTPAHSAATSTGKIDAYLAAMVAGNPGGKVALIVKGNGSAAITNAVARHGGVVTADLWLIGAVAASVDAAAVAALAGEPDVLALSPDKPVERAAGPGDRTAPNRLNASFNPGGTVDLDPLTDAAGNAFLLVAQNGAYKAQKVGANGTLLWVYTFGSNSDYKPVGAVVTSGGDLVVATARSGLYALTTRNNAAALLWKYNAAADAAPALGADGTIYFSANKTAYALTAAGQLKWTRSLGRDAAVVAPSPLAGGVVFLTGSNGTASKVVFVAANNGSSWTWSTKSGLLAGPTVAGTRLLFADGRTVVALNASNGSIAWRSADLGGTLAAAPLVSGSGSAIALVANIGLLGLNGNSGAKQWTAQLTSTGTSSLLALAAGRYAAVGVSNKVYVYDTTNGTATGVPYTLDSGNEVRSLISGPNGFFYAYSTKNRFMLLAQDGALYWSYSLYIASGDNRPRQKGRDKDEEKTSVSADPTYGSGMDIAPDGSAFVIDGADNLNLLGALAATTDAAAPDVSDIDLAHGRMKLSYNAAIDTGADLVYRRGVTGAGVTVALLDSGVHYDAAMQALDTRTQYSGQVDFVTGGANPPLTRYSTDPYGHGSHVASIILNPFVDQLTNTYIGMAPDAKLVSVRVLDAQGQGSYSTVIAGLQWVVSHKSQYGIGVVNYSIVARATAPYWADPLDIAAERVWQAGIVLVAAAGNDGPGALSVSVPANSPYVLTVGALNGNRTAGLWGDDYVNPYSAAGPTLDGFVKPDVVAPGSRIVGFMQNSGPDTAYLTTVHPDAAAGYTFYRMSGTSQATAIVSGIATLVLQQNPALTPGQVKYRLMATAMPFVNLDGSAPYSIFEQGTGRVWAPAAVFGTLDNRSANAGLDLNSDVGPAWSSNLAAYSNPDYTDTAWRLLHPQVRHYQGPALYNNLLGKFTMPGMLDPSSNGSYTNWAGGYTNWAGGYTNWAGGYTNWAGGYTNWAGGYTNWAGGYTNWAGGYTNWAGGYTNWAGAVLNWAGGYTNWAGGYTNWAGGYTNWAGSYGDIAFAATFATCAAVPAGSNGASSMRWVTP